MGFRLLGRGGEGYEAVGTDIESGRASGLVIYLCALRFIRGIEGL